MKFVVNDIAAIPDAGGVYSILSDFYFDVLNKDHTNEWIFILAGRFFPESENVKIVVRPDLKAHKLKKLFFERWSGRKYINRFRPDIYISLQNIATYGVKAKLQIVYLHQPIPFEKEKIFSFYKKSEQKLAVYQHLIGSFIKQSLSTVSPTVIVQTRWMKKAVIAQTKLNRDNIVVKHPRVDVKDESKYKGKGNLFFYPASNYIYKNHELIYKAINILKENGVKDFKVDFTLRSDQLEYADDCINYIGHISRDKVMRMYNTHVLIFPSYIESFGLPLIEAAVHSDIILASDTEFSHELLRNYTNVFYYPVNDASKLAKLMENTIIGKINSDGKQLNIMDNGESLLETVRKIVDKND